MKKLLIIPDVNNIEESLELAKKYDLGFEYNDFFDPDVLDDENKMEELVALYKKYKSPSYSTMHGAFYDVIPFSKDRKIREVSELRVMQSIDVAKRLGVSAVVFHTNYNPFLNTPAYIEIWLEESIKFWSGILEENRDINIYLENMFDSSPEIMKNLSEALCKYDNYGVCLDYGHASISKVLPEEWARCLGKYVKHIHINDNDLIGDLHLAWGEGKIDREVFYRSYAEYMSEATVLIEVSSIKNQMSSIEKFAKEGFIYINSDFETQ